jgi:putative transposase
MIYHVCTRSIAGFIVFNNENEYARAQLAMQYFRLLKRPMSFSKFLSINCSVDSCPHQINELNQSTRMLVRIIAYCFMPTHIHLLVEELIDDGLARYMSNLLNSYARYFNIKHRRKGPLWESRFNRVDVNDDDQLLHLTRYIHLNPVTAYLVDKPEQWAFSSYGEYIQNGSSAIKVCNYDDLLTIKPKSYRSFVEENISYQRELAKIKSMILE